MNIYENVKDACRIRGVSVKKIEEESDMGKRTMYNWATSAPAADKLLKVSKLLKTTMEYLMGETEDIDAIIVSPIGENTASMTIEEKELLSLFQSVSVEGKAAIMTAARAFAGQVDYTKKESAGVTA